MTWSAHQPSNQPGLSGKGMEGREEGEGSESDKKRQSMEEGEGMQGCTSFKHAGLNGKDSSDI